MGISDRSHALDNLRALMMWLGIVLHVALIHMVTPSAAAFWRDQSTSVAADFIFLTIHSFRMPVFFILAGYFAALLVQGRGYEGMLRHRLRRIALPFVVFWPALFVSMVLLIMAYVHVMARGTIGLDASLLPQPAPGRPMIGTIHLWFLYDLLWLCLLAYVAGTAGRRFVNAGVWKLLDRCWYLLGRSWWGALVLGLPLALIGAGYPGGLIAPSGSFVPHLDELVYSGIFFVFGWCLHRHRDDLLPRYSRYWWRYALAGLAVFVVSLGFFNALALRHKTAYSLASAIAFTYNLVAWLWSFALIGVFNRYLSAPSRLLRYVSESSYWVYLVHLPAAIGFGILLYHFPAGALAKMTLNILLTTASCLATYHLLVRRTWLGVLLNGKRRPARRVELPRVAA